MLSDSVRVVDWRVTQKIKIQGVALFACVVHLSLLDN